MPARPRNAVTVVVCTKGRGEFLPAALASLDADLGPGDELLLMEDGDSGGAAVVSTVGCDHRHVLEHGRWRSWMLNRGLEGARTDIVLLTDDDCRVEPGWVNAMVQPFDDPRVAVVAGPVTGITAPVVMVQPGAGPAPTTPWTYAHGASLALRRAAALEVGGFDERLGAGTRIGAGEDHDLVHRLQAVGYRAVIADAPPIVHLDWRDKGASVETLLRYERGSGAWLGAAVRRDARQAWPVLRQRLGFQLAIYRWSRAISRVHGPRTSLAFLGGLVHGLAFAPRRWV